MNTKEQESEPSILNSLFKNTAVLSVSLTKLRLIGYNNLSEVEGFQNKLTIDLPLFLTITRRENYLFSLEEFIYTIDRFIDYIFGLENANPLLYQQFSHLDVVTLLMKLNWELLLINSLYSDNE